MVPETSFKFILGFLEQFQKILTSLFQHFLDEIFKPNIVPLIFVIILHHIVLSRLIHFAKQSHPCLLILLL